MLAAADLLRAYPLVRCRLPHPARGGTLWEVQHAPTYRGEVVMRAQAPGGRGLLLVQGASGWPLCGSVDEQVAFSAWAAYRAPDAWAAIGAVWWRATEGMGGPLDLDREKGRLLASLLRADGYTHATTVDRDGRRTMFVLADTPLSVLYFNAGDVLIEDGAWVRWRSDAGFLHAVTPPPEPAAWEWGGGYPGTLPCRQGGSFRRNVSRSPGARLSARHLFLRVHAVPKVQNGVFVVLTWFVRNLSRDYRY